MLAGTAMRFVFLTRKPFWFDECFSAEVARLPWHDFAMLLWRREANMVLYYLLLHGWLHFSLSPFFIRSLSVILSLAALPAIFWLAEKLFDRRVALLAVALLSFNAYHIRYAQEARSYSLFVLLSILSSGFFIDVLREPTRRNRWAYVLASVFAVYAHLYALLLLPVHWLSVQSLTRSLELTRKLRIAWISIGIATLPMIVFAAKTGAGPLRWIPRPGFFEVLAFAEQITGNYGIGLLSFYAAAFLIAIVASGSKRSDSQTPGHSWRLRFLFLWAAFPVALVLLLSWARPLFLGRYFIFCLPPVVILAAEGLSKLRKPWLIGVGLAAMLSLSLLGTFSYYNHDFDLDRDDSAGSTNYVLKNSQPRDAIIFHIAEARVPYEFFKSIRAAGIADGSDDGPEIVYPRHGDLLEYRDFTGKPTAEFVRSLSGRYTRLWVVLMSNGDPAHPDATTLMLNEALGESYGKPESSEFSKAEVRLYRKP
jgi:hypothetical protein